MKTPVTQRALAIAIGMAAAHGMQAYAATPAGTSITNQASATYLDASSVSRTATSNTVVTVVQQVASVSVSAGAAKTANAGAQVVYAHTITNDGNGNDSFTLASTNSGAFQMTNVQFFADANGDGVADNATPITSTGSLAPGATFRVVAVASLPAGAAAGATNSLVVSATSAFNGAVSASATDTTTAGAAAAIDITANSPGAGAPGAGPGAEASAVTTNTTAAGSTTRFTLYLNNSGASGDTFNLAASIDSSFGSTTLPSGWSVVFKDASGAVITSAAVAANANVVVYADVTVAAGATPGTTDLYFRALSPTSNVSDRIHDAVIVSNAVTAVTLSKTQALDAACDGSADTAFSAANITTGAVPGACIRYEITATNGGGAPAASVVISDAIPASTTYHATAPASATAGTVVAPGAGQTGTVVATVGVLAPNASVKLSFGVRINP